MSEYTMVTSVKGDRYMKDKRFIAKSKIPPKILAKLELDRPVSDEYKEVQPPTKKCLYEGDDAKLSRVINQQTVYLCNDHYYSKTVGQLAQRIREYNDEENSQVL